MSGAFGITQNSAGKGLEARDLRKIIEGSYSNTGIITGGTVTGNNNLTYHIADTVGLASRGSSDGMSVFYLAASDTPPVSAGASSTRIDTIWVKAVDPDYDDDKYGVELGVDEGTPSQTPQPPSLAPGKTRIIDMLVRANVTNLQTGASVYGSYDYAIPYGASLGRLAITEDNRTDVHGDPTIRKWFYEYPTRFYVPTDRFVELQYDADVSYQGAGGNWMTWATEFMLDGTGDQNRVPHTARETNCRDQVWTHCTNRALVKVSQGFHTMWIKQGIANKAGNGYPYFHFGENDGLDYPGRTVQVWDRGVAR